MNRDSITRAILGDGVEDYTGLWEVLWGLRKQFDLQSDLQIRARVEPVMRNLLHEGLIAIYEGTTYDGDEKRLSAEQAVAALGDFDSWNEPEPNERHKRYVATEKGEREYFDRGE